MQSDNSVESLTKILTNLVEQLRATQQPQPTNITPNQAQKETPTKVVRTPNMTYSQYLSKVLKERHHVPTRTETSKKSSYKLYEDLEIMLDMSNHKVIDSKIYEALSESGKLNRTADSIKARFLDFLVKVQEKDMKRIVEYVEKEGIDGYLIHQNGEFKVLKADPLEVGNDGPKRQRPESLQNEGRKVERQIKRTVPAQCTELNSAMSMYSKMVNVPVKTLLERLDQLSGDVIALDKFIETKDEHMLWTEEDDKILIKGGIELQVLKKFRGERELEKRKAYLGIS